MTTTRADRPRARVTDRGALRPTGGFAPDPEIAARDALLDPNRMARHLATLLGRAGDDPDLEATLVRAKYRVGESLRVSYRLKTDRGLTTVSGRTFPPAECDTAYERAVRKATASERAGPVIHDAEHHTVWWVLPSDRRLPAIPELLRPDPATARRVAIPGWVSSEVAEYAPERSITLRARSESGEILGYVKHYAPDTIDVARFASRYEAVAASLDAVDDVRSPRVIGVDESHDTLVLEPMPGTPWGELGVTGAVGALERLGRAMAHLHGLRHLRIEAGLAPFGRLSQNRIRHSADLVARARPDVAAAVLDLVRELLARRPVLDRTDFLHGDCHPKNALDHPSGLALIDLDQAGVGPAASDIGSLVARLRAGTIVGERTVADEQRMLTAFLDGYAMVAPLPSAEVLRWYTSACIVAERAIRAVNRVQHDALAHLGELVDAARSTLDGTR